MSDISDVNVSIFSKYSPPSEVLESVKQAMIDGLSNRVKTIERCAPETQDAEELEFVKSLIVQSSEPSWWGIHLVPREQL
jgi:hypothetical protein